MCDSDEVISWLWVRDCVRELISQYTAIWIRTVKMNVTDEHMHFVSVSHVHFYGE